MKQPGAPQKASYAGAAASPPVSGWRVTTVRFTLLPERSHCARATALPAPPRPPPPSPSPPCPPPRPAPHESVRARAAHLSAEGARPWKIPLPSSLHPVRLLSSSVLGRSASIPAAFASTKWQPPCLGACPAYPGPWDGGLGRWVGTRRMEL